MPMIPLCRTARYAAWVMVCLLAASPAGWPQLPFDDVSLPLVYSRTGIADVVARASLDPFTESILVASADITLSAEPNVNPINGWVLYSRPGPGDATPLIWLFQPNSLATGPLTTDTGNFAGEFSPVWHPNGNTFYFVRKISSIQSVLVMRGGSGFRSEAILPVTLSSVHRQILHPEVSPTGSSIAYVSQETGSLEWRLYRTGTTTLALTRTLIRNAGATQIDHPTWSRHGDRLLYVQRQTLPDSSSIRTINANATADAQVLSLSGETINGLEWARDDSLVAFSAVRNDGASSAIRLMTSQGTGVAEAAASAVSDYSGVSWGPGYPRLFIEVLDASTGLPIPGATVIGRLTGTKAGFEIKYVGDASGPRYESQALTPGEYTVTAAAAGYLAGTLDGIVATPGAPQALQIELTENPAADALGQLAVFVLLLDANSIDTKTRIVPDTVIIKFGLSEPSTSKTFLDGAVRAFEVPPGLVTISAILGADYTAPPATFLMGFGQNRKVILQAQRAIALPRADIPGQIVGTVQNTAFDPAEPLASARVYFVLEADASTFYAQTDLDGIYFFPDVPAGTGTLQAFTADSTHSSGVLEIDVIAGSIFGDDSGEDTLLEVVGVDYDSDGDGMDDEFETANALDPLDSSGENGAEGDPELDGAPNLQEYLYGTDPNVSDVDNDTWTDGQEIAAGSDPLEGADVPPPLDIVWLDFGYADADAIGTVDRPFEDVGGALGLVTDGGEMNIKGDVTVTTSDESAILIDRAVTVSAINGTVTIGQAP